MTKIKICGLRSKADIAIMNKYKPDYAGFIIDFPKSFRSLDIAQVRQLTKELSPDIQAVGVFVNEDIQTVISLLRDGTIKLAQLHGDEDEEYIKEVKKAGQVIKAFQIHLPSDIEKAEKSSADYILLDQGKGGGKTFDWSLIPSLERDYFLAGGINEKNIDEAIKRFHPYAIDLSSGVETNKVKDETKIRKVIEKGRHYE